MGRARQGVLGLRPLAVPVLVAALVHALLFVTSPPDIAIDSPSYLAHASSLVASGESLNARGEPDTVRTPGYPLFLAVFLAAGIGVGGAVAAQRLLWIALVALTTVAGWRGSRSRVAAVTAGLVVALDLPALQAANAVLTETLAAVLVAAAAWQAYRAAASGSLAGAAAAGVISGAAAMVRPVAILLGLPLAIALFAGAPRGRRGRLAAVLLGVSLLLPAAWTARNYVRTGVATFSSISSVNLLVYRAAGTLAVRDPGGIDVNLATRQQQLEALACAELARVDARPCGEVPIAERASRYGAIALPIILGDPAATAAQAARAFVMIVFGGGAVMLSGLTGMGESAARATAFGYTVPLALLALLGIRFWWRIDRTAALLMGLTIAYMVGMSLGAEAYSRFRVPILPLYAMLAGGGAAALATRWTASPSR